LKLIIQPDDGVSPLIAAIKGAKRRIDVAIFRFDQAQIEKALKDAVSRGVKVKALIASVNHGGEKGLRKLEMRFLEAGITVARTASELIRYHDKIILIDQRTLYVLSFNFTHLDIDHSRGFGIVTANAKWVGEAIKLLDADFKRTPYTSGTDTFVVSPSNARKVLGIFLKRAKKQLLIYDPKISDKEMISILKDRSKTGVDIRIIGQTDAPLPVKKLGNFRLHTRTIIRDGSQAFVGSQSLRNAELDSRREVGLIIRDTKIVRKLMDTFESDWEASGGEKEKPANEDGEAMSKEETEKTVKILMQELDPIANTVKKTVKKVVAKAGEDVLEDGSLQETVKVVVKKVMKQAVKEAVKK
jgi:phosphatidylserine/phosphatidylglycerophosphate/cardiolipin synthase-like enzyme